MISEAERLKKMVEPFRQLQAHLDTTLYSSMQEIHKRFETTVGTLQRIHDQIGSSWKNSIQQVYANLEACIEPFRQLQASFDTKLYSSMQEIHKRIETAAAGTLKRIHDQFESSWVNSIQQIHDSLKRSIYSSNIQQQFQSLNETALRFHNIFDGINIETLAVNEDGTVSLSGASISLADINQTVLDIIQKDDEGISAHDFFEHILDKLKEFKKPIQAIILTILIPFFISIFAGLSTPYFKNALTSIYNENKQSIIREVKKQSIEKFQFQDLNSYRFVRADILNVREKPKRKSEKIGELYLGQVVLVLVKKRNWTFIEYIDDETDETLSGWVFTRRLEKFKQ